MIAGAGTGDVEQVALGIVNVLQVSLIGHTLYPFLKWNDLVIASHHRDCPEFQTLGQVHCADGQSSNRRHDVFIENIKTKRGCVCRGLGPVQRGDHLVLRAPLEQPVFQRLVVGIDIVPQAGEFLEFAEVFGNYYGTHNSALEKAKAAGKDLVLDIDVQGAAQLKKRIPDAVTIFVLAPSREILEQRLRARSQDSDETIRTRLANAAREIRNYNLYDYVLVNNDLNLAAETLKAIVRAERVKRVRVEEKIRPLLASFGQTPGV